MGVTLTGAAVVAPAAAAQVESAWVELKQGRKASVRAIVTEGECPTVRVNGARKQMGERAAPTPPDYDVLTCEKGLGTGAKRIEVAGEKLRPPRSKPNRIAVVGDTGCRLEGAGDSQACNDPEAWPFEQVADAIAEWRPRLIVHVGDYLYREEPCPAGDSGCAGSPSGYNWPTWDADFFDPAAAALGAAPWVFVRGNHESCDRAAEGWFRFLEPRPVPPSCTDFTDPYATRVGHGRLVVLDTSAANDFSPYNPEPFVSQFQAMNRLVGPRKAFLLTHKPIWGAAATDGGTSFAVTNTSLELASSNSLPGRVRAVLAGHLHTSEVFNFEGGRAPQIVAGNGGTALDDQITVPIEGTVAAGARIVDAVAESRFGFLTMAKRDPGWKLALRSPDGKAFARCPLVKKTAPCGPG